MEDNKNLPAFPQSCSANEFGIYLATHSDTTREAVVGLTKRELIAAMVLQGFISNPTYYTGYSSDASMAQQAVSMAGALLTELSKS